jgi:predicted DNA-binding transcriptional regulator AlpA
MPTKDLMLRLAAGPSVHQHLIIGRGLGLRQCPWPVGPATTHIQPGRRHYRSHDATTGRRRRPAIFPGRLLRIAHGSSQSGAGAPRAKSADPPTFTPKPLRESKSTDRLLTPKEAAEFLRVSTSWLAKARMRGDGPPYVKIGRAIRYPESALYHWMKSRMHLSTGER